jgi:predicted HTH domain antitoxin
MATLTLEVPEELVALLGSPEVAAKRAREALVLHLFREGHVGEARAAHWLGISRWDFLDLIAQHHRASERAGLEDWQLEAEGLKYFLQDPVGTRHDDCQQQ